MTYHSEPARDTPLVDHTDVLVCGGGPAGVAAALAAARAGARVTLIESQGCLGGVWTSGLLSYIIDGDSSRGLIREIVMGITRMEGRPPKQDIVPPPTRVKARPGILYSAETMKIVLDELCASAGIKVRLYTRVVAAARDDKNVLAVVLTESKNGREAWRANVFIDCTGDGDLAAHAGCGFDFGRPGTGETQPMTLMGLVTGLSYDAVARFIVGGREGHYQGKAELLAEMRRAGHEPSYLQPTLFHLHSDLYALMANHEYGRSALDAAELTAATIAARAEVFQIVRALRRVGAPWSEIELVATSNHIGVREGRRVHGRYTVSREDLIAGIRHDDAVCHVSFPVDVHATTPAEGKGYSSEGVMMQPYDIPLRALVARDVEGLLLAGRCISGDFFAHASYRVTGYAVELGEAAGLAAAWCARRCKLPRDASWADIIAMNPAVT
jgi:hypothetical protein